MPRGCIPTSEAAPCRASPSRKRWTPHSPSRNRQGAMAQGLALPAPERCRGTRARSSARSRRGEITGDLTPIWEDRPGKGRDARGTWVEARRGRTTGTARSSGSIRSGTAWLLCAISAADRAGSGPAAGGSEAALYLAEGANTMGRLTPWLDPRPCGQLQSMIASALPPVNWLRARTPARRRARRLLSRPAPRARRRGGLVRLAAAPQPAPWPG